jgi:hypothetical protein
MSSAKPDHRPPERMARLRPASDRFVARVASRLIDDLPTITERLSRRILTEDPFYSKVVPTMGDEVRATVDRNLGQFVRGLAGLEPIDLELSRQLARRRAEQGVPLAALLNAHRMAAQTVWEYLVAAGHSWAQQEFDLDEVLDGSGQVWALSDTFSRLISESYEQALAERSHRSERERALLFDALVEGRTQDVSFAGDVARVLGLPERGVLVAVVAEVLVPDHEPLPGIDHALRARAIRSAWRMRGPCLVGIVTPEPAAAERGPREIREVIAGRATARVGMSPSYGAILDTARHVALAETAMQCVPPGEAGVALFDDHPLGLLVAGAPDVAERMAALVLGPVLDLPGGQQQTLLGTLTAWIEEGGSVARAGQRLYCHRNTVRNRLQRIEELTGRSLSEPKGLAEICLAAKAVSLRPKLRPAS